MTSAEEVFSLIDEIKKKYGLSAINATPIAKLILLNQLFIDVTVILQKAAEE